MSRVIHEADARLNAQPHGCGLLVEAHSTTRRPPHAGDVAEAQRLKQAGWNIVEITRLLNRDGVGVSRLQVGRWLDPEMAERHRAASRTLKRRARGRRTSALAHTSPEFRVEIMRDLRAQGIPWSSIAKAHGVLFGEPLDEKTVKARVTEGA